MKTHKRTARRARPNAAAPSNAIDFSALCAEPPKGGGMLLDPLLAEASLTLLYGPRGIGKTYLALSIAYAVASGSDLLRWRGTAPKRVLYVDGEMPRGALALRLGAIAAGAGSPPPTGHLRVLASDDTGKERPELGTRAGRALIERAIGDGVDLVVLDSLSVLLRGGRMNPAHAWSEVEAWLLSLRRRGIAVLLVRNGSPGRFRPGTTRHADVLDTAIALRRPADYDPAEGARFEFHMPKARTLLGPAARPFEARLIGTEDALSWTTLSPRDALLVRAARLFAEGFSVRDVGTRLGISKSKAHNLRGSAFALLAQAGLAGCPNVDSPRTAPQG
jgi:putative DNA primase/helicase